MSKSGVDANDPPLMAQLLVPIKNNVSNNPRSQNYDGILMHTNGCQVTFQTLYPFLFPKPY